MKRKAGFGLVEVLIALVLLVIALFAIASTFIVSSQLMVHTYEKEKAVMLGSERLDVLEAGDYDTIVTSSDQAGIYTRSWAVSEDSHSKNVTMIVTWDGVLRDNSSFTIQREISEFADNEVLD